MPAALDTSEIYRYVISTDRAKDEKPTLLFHYPSCREQRKIMNLFDAADAAPTIDEMLLKTVDAIKIVLIGWENVFDREGKAVPFNVDEVDAVLSEIEFSELRHRLFREMSLNELEKKRAAFSAQYNLESSAKNATAAVA